MKKIKIKPTALVAACAFGLAVSASAQSQPGAASVPPNPAATGSSYGLIGNTYSEVDFGYLRQDAAPKVTHDYDFTYNQAFLKTAGGGLDGNLAYDFLSGGAFGVHDYRNELQAGLTGYLAPSWGKPFATADAGQAWDRVAGFDGKSLVYTFTGGVEFQVSPAVVLTPFVEYQAEPWLANHAPVADLPTHDWDYGVKATYRFTPQWGVSLGLAMDQYSRDDLGYRAGLSYHF